MGDPEDAQSRIASYRELRHEQDPFRLAIRGHASIETTIAEGIATTFVGQVPAELRRLSFRTNLALAIALGLVPESLKAPLTQLARLRHDFAHGNLDELQPTRARAIVDALRPIAPRTMAKLEGAEPIEILRIGLIAMRSAVTSSISGAQAERQRQQRAVVEQHAETFRRAMVSALREVGTDSPSDATQ